VKPVWIIVAAAVLAFGQTAPKKGTAADGKKTAAPAAKPDTWERSKECAAQAEKMMSARDAQIVAEGGTPATIWSNHYSLKYNRCFVEAYYGFTSKAYVKGGPMTHTVLIDAFERSGVAAAATGLEPEIACRGEDKSDECLSIARMVWKGACTTDGAESTCEAAEQFIKEHMKN
jgi:hypothetical protein